MATGHPYLLSIGDWVMAGGPKYFGADEPSTPFEVCEVTGIVERQRYLRMFFEGNRPTEIAEACGVSLGTVSSSVTRSMQFMQRYFKHEIELWNKIK